jgi:hypothetical protein
MSSLFNFITPYLSYLKIGAWLAVGILIGWLFMQKGYYQGKYLTAQGTIIQKDAKIEEWRSSNQILLTTIGNQNQSIEALGLAKNEAEKRALEAIKKAKPRVQARQVIINKPPAPANNSTTCEEAVAKAVSDLEGSDL